MNSKILIAHTCFHKRFKLNNRAKELLKTFGRISLIDEICFKENTITFNDDLQYAKSKDSFRLILVSDKGFEKNSNQIKTKLSNILDEKDLIYLFWHQTYGPDFYHYLRETYPNQLVANRACHHEENEPFFYLKDIVESNSLEEFTTRLQNLRDCLPSDEDLKNNKLKERILTVIIPKLRSRKKPSEEELQILETRIPSIREISNDSEEILRILNVIYQ